MKLHFITFGAGNQHYHDAVNRICYQAKQFNMFKNIFGYTEKNLQDNKDFWTNHGQFILSNPRGYGYWIWKCFIILDIMKRSEINDGDIITYVDSGCELNIRGRQRMIEYIKLAMEHDILAFQMEHLDEKKYSKMDLLEYAQVPREHRDSGQCVGGILFFKKTRKNIEILTEITKLLTMENYHFIDDTPSKLPNDPIFIDHRHDQSCISITLKKYGAFLLKDETYFSNWNDGLSYPILAFRNRTGFSYLPW